ncbi:GGDEF domain-containing protein [Gordonia aichiensis]|uniref:GGDEF domain-containing protein n=1 Tax=Gordonia aichiensis NBRC 108223 TaxID=1220583 RepID=L7KU06_9ACTN|nr:GGDEF domain-containing protein [Gordonia aichiensis]GAC51198.1 hypothetical protein GOACH_58_00530 [Gordonia aichiensis NBRC 108223]
MRENAGDAPDHGSRTTRELVSNWWSGPDHYEWLSTYLATRGRQRPTALLVAGAVLLFGMVELLMMFSPAGPSHDVWRRGAAAGVVVACVAMSVVWLRRSWPSRRWSTVFVITAAVCIGVGALIERDDMSAIAACGLFGVLGGYVGIFHSVRLLVVNFTIAVLVVAVLAVRIGVADGAVLAIAKSLALLGSFTAIPVLCQLLLERLGPDALNSDTDALTGLLNRRGFYARAGDLIANRAGSQDILLVALIDLDDFKRINDTFGHEEGDAALAEVARALTDCAGASTLVARLGGEEFVVAETVGVHDDVLRRGRAVGRAITANTHGVTASVGLVTVTIAAGHLMTATGFDDVIRLADHAMYDAKRAGGNRVCHHAGDVGPGTAS